MLFDRHSSSSRPSVLSRDHSLQWLLVLPCIRLLIYAIVKIPITAHRISTASFRSLQNDKRRHAIHNLMAESCDRSMNDSAGPRTAGLPSISCKHMRACTVRQRLRPLGHALAYCLAYRLRRHKTSTSLCCQQILTSCKNYMQGPWQTLL